MESIVEQETEVPRKSGKLVLPGLSPLRALGSRALTVLGTTYIHCPWEGLRSLALSWPFIKTVDSRDPRPFWGG